VQEVLPRPDRADEVVVITEKMFVAQTNDVYLNSDDYLGKTIQYEGLFQSWTDQSTGITYYTVIRYGPGCCGNDANCGFEVIWKTPDAAYPGENDWVAVSGILEAYLEFGSTYLRLELVSLEKTPQSGSEYVTQ